MAEFRWRLYYADGSEYSDTDGLAQASPGIGLVCIAQPCAQGEWYTVLTNGDHYLYREDRGYWTGHDLPGTLAELVDDAHNISCVRAGKYVTKPVFHDCWAKARTDANAAGVVI